MVEEINQLAEITPLVPFTKEAIHDISRCLESSKLYCLLKDESAFVRKFQLPLSEYFEKNEGLISDLFGEKAANFYERGCYIANKLFRYQCDHAHKRMPRITQYLIKSYLQDNFEKGLEDPSSIVDAFIKLKVKLEKDECNIYPLIKKIVAQEDSESIFTIAGFADVYYLYKKAINTEKLESMIIIG